MWLQGQLGLRSSALECLAGLDGFKVREYARPKEALAERAVDTAVDDERAGFLGTVVESVDVEEANHYKVYKIGGWDDLFDIVERTDYLSMNLKQFCPGCIPWTVDIRYSQGLGREEAFRVDRPASCTCCCFNRGMASMTDMEGTTLGYLVDSFKCLGQAYTFTILGPDSSPIFSITQVDSQSDEPGVMEFTISDASSGDEVGTVTQREPKKNIWGADDLDNYYVTFRDSPLEPEHKALVLAMAIYMDVQHFNGGLSVMAPLQEKMGLSQPLVG